MDLGRARRRAARVERLVERGTVARGRRRLLMLGSAIGTGRQADAVAAGRRARTVLAEGLPALHRALRVERLMETANPRAGPRSERAAAGGAGDRCAVARRGALKQQPHDGNLPVQGAGHLPGPQDAPLFCGRKRLVVGPGAVGWSTHTCLSSGGSSGAGQLSVIPGRRRSGTRARRTAGKLTGGTRRFFKPGRTPVDSRGGVDGDTPPAAPVLLVLDQFEELWTHAGRPRGTVGLPGRACSGSSMTGIAARCIVGRAGRPRRAARRAPGLLRAARGHPGPGPCADRPRVLRGGVSPPAPSGCGSSPGWPRPWSPTSLGRPGRCLCCRQHWSGPGSHGAAPCSHSPATSRPAGSKVFLPGPRRRPTGGSTEPSRELARSPAPAARGHRRARRSGPSASRWPSSTSTGKSATWPAGGVTRSFVERRLFAVDEGRLEVAHEALLTSWPRLARGWRTTP